MAEAKSWARRLVQRDDWLVIDVETTGLDENAEIVEAAVVGPRGDTLFDAVMRPRTPPDPGTSRVHGLTAEALHGEAPYEQFHRTLDALLTGRLVVAYNAAFDRQVLAHTCQVAGLPPIGCTWDCAMLRYEQWRGFHASLATACEVESIDAPALRHRALPDARLVWRLMRRMAGESP